MNLHKDSDYAFAKQKWHKSNKNLVANGKKYISEMILVSDTLTILKNVREEENLKRHAEYPRPHIDPSL